MRSKILKTFLGISLLALIGGCNPYASKLICGKDAPFGSCGSTPEIYSEIVNGPKAEGSVATGEVALDTCPDCEKGNKAVTPAHPRQSALSAYQEAALAKAASLLKKPVTPLVIPPTVGCIWFPPMMGENSDVLNMEQYVCIILDKPRFVMGDYLNKSGE